MNGELLESGLAVLPCCVSTQQLASPALEFVTTADADNACNSQLGPWKAWAPTAAGFVRAVVKV